jgi:diguanylate cyclase (GGDEF)-like protein
VASFAVRIGTGLAAAWLLARAVRRHQGVLARAQLFFAAAMAIGMATGLATVAHVARTGDLTRTGSLIDWIHLCFGPLAVLGVLSLPRTGGPHGGVLRELADGAVAAGSLWYLTRVLFIDSHGLAETLQGAAKVSALMYPLLPAFVAAMFLSAIPRVVAACRPFLYRMTAAVGVLGVGNVAIALMSWQETPQPTWWIAGLNQLGVLLILDAALVGIGPAAARAEPGADVDLNATRGVIVIGAPFAPMVVAIVVACAEMAAGRGIPPAQVAPLLLVGAAVVVRHVAGARETSRLVARIAAREQAARHQARTDPLTGLPHRGTFVDLLDDVLADPAAHPVAVALLDLNDFKDINDTHGHDTGDAVLRHTAARLRAAVPSGGIARLGGDEFAAFLPACSDGGASLARVLAAAFAKPVVVGRRSFQVRPSVGVVVDERPAGTARRGDGAHLLAHADVAMYQAKSTKAVHEAPVTVLAGDARRSAAATIRMREEIAIPVLDQFRVEYQPIVDLNTGEITAAEALLRWRHPEFGEVSPATFIPLAERVGSMAALGDHVLRLAIDDLVTWSRAGASLSVTVNVSPRQLIDPALAESVVSLLATRGLDAGRLMLEITEEALVDDLEAVVETIAALRRAGVSIAVDDFGTGYSSLRYLRRFEAHAVKIDREFVQASSVEPRTEALVRSVVSMANALDLVCVAEGIETLEQLALVRAHGCHLGQGFLLDRPMPADAMGDLLASGHVYPVDVTAPRRVPAAPPAEVVPLHRAR